MGNDCRLFCLDCNDTEYMARAYNYKKEVMNKVIPSDLLDKLKVLKLKILSVIDNFDFHSDTCYDHLFETEIEFLEEHKGHKVMIIDDNFEVLKDD